MNSCSVVETEPSIEPIDRSEKANRVRVNVALFVLEKQGRLLRKLLAKPGDRDAALLLKAIELGKIAQTPLGLVRSK